MVKNGKKAPTGIQVTSSLGYLSGLVDGYRYPYMKKQLKIPKFKDEDEEIRFWSKLDLSEYFQPEDFGRVSFPNLKPTSRSISIRIPEYILNRLKEKANEIAVPYQSLIKGYIKEGLFSTAAPSSVGR